jgi:hypothetical protein
MDRRIFDMLERYNQANGKTQEYLMNADDNSNFDGVLTMAFVNMQPLDTVYETEDGFSKGTIFPNIDKPLEVKRI